MDLVSGFKVSNAVVYDVELVRVGSLELASLSAAVITLIFDLTYENKDHPTKYQQQEHQLEALASLQVYS